MIIEQNIEDEKNMNSPKNMKEAMRNNKGIPDLTGRRKMDGERVQLKYCR